jgi:hypothetical protein
VILSFRLTLWQWDDTRLASSLLVNVKESVTGSVLFTIFPLTFEVPQPRLV